MTITRCPSRLNISVTPARHAVLDLKDSGEEPVVSQALVVVQGIESRRFDRLLPPHVEHRDIEQDLKGLLVLGVRAWAAEREERLAVPQHDGRAQGGARALLPSDHVRVLPVQHERLQPVSEGNTGVDGDEDAAEDEKRFPLASVT
jgi:hypothetical protein